MTDLMSAAEFCNHANGKPWVNRAEGPGEYDCWGVVLASFRLVDGVELPKIEGYADKECSTGDAAKQVDMSLFTPSQPVNGAIMCIFDNKENLIHVGRCLCGRILHATSVLGVVHSTYAAINNKHRNVRYFKYDN